MTHLPPGVAMSHSALVYKCADGSAVSIVRIGELALFVGGAGKPYFYVIRMRVFRGRPK
jgi:hypothetical protein